MDSREILLTFCNANRTLNLNLIIHLCRDVKKVEEISRKKGKLLRAIYNKSLNDQNIINLVLFSFFFFNYKKHLQT